MTPDELKNRWRWSAIALGIIVGGILVGAGLADGNAWMAMVGGVLSGGSSVAGSRPT